MVKLTYSDPAVECLSVKQKLLYAYLATNTLTTELGVYQITIPRISFETGIDQDEIRDILKVAEQQKLIYYYRGFIVLQGFFDKHSGDPQFIRAAFQQYLLLPGDVVEYMGSISFRGTDKLQRYVPPQNHLEYAIKNDLWHKPQKMNTKF